MNSDYCDVKIKKSNRNRYKVYINWRDYGWKNEDYLGKIVFADLVKEWWFIPEKHGLLSSKGLRIIADKIDKLTEAIS